MVTLTDYIYMLMILCHEKKNFTICIQQSNTLASILIANEVRDNMYKTEGK